MKETNPGFFQWFHYLHKVYHLTAFSRSAINLSSRQGQFILVLGRSRSPVKSTPVPRHWRQPGSVHRLWFWYASPKRSFALPSMKSLTQAQASWFASRPVPLQVWQVLREDPLPKSKKESSPASGGFFFSFLFFSFFCFCPSWQGFRGVLVGFREGSCETSF